MESSPNDHSNAEFAKAPTDSALLGEDNFRHLAEALPSIVFTATPEGEIDYFSARWGQFGGLSENDPGYLDWVARVHPDDVNHLSKTWAISVETEEIFEGEFRLRSATDEYLWFHTKVIPVRDSELKIVKWYGVTTDINERKETELQLRKTSEEKDEFLAMLGHELRNPLAAISTSYEVLTRAGADEKQKETVFALLGKQVEHLTRLVDDTLDISRLSSGKLRLVTCPVEINQLVIDCCANYQEQAATKEVALTSAIGKREIWVNGDDVRISQCLTNLLDNAVKFTDPGGTIEIRVKTEGESAVIEVTDSGVGMTQKEIARIFEPFEQGLGAQQLSTAGLGLGLAVIEKLVTMHQGSISVHSDGKEKGTTFGVRLPLIEAPAPAEEGPVEDEKIGTLKILLLEDNESVALSLQMFFELEGHEIRVAPDGDTALALLEEETPDLLLSDLTLPGLLSGWDIAEKVAGSYPAQHLPYLVALSGHTQPHHREKSFEAGFNEHLAKPPTPQQLRDVLINGHNYLTKKRTR